MIQVKQINELAQFFVEPLMLKTAMEREREAVDSEYQMTLPSDYKTSWFLLLDHVREGFI